MVINMKQIVYTGIIVLFALMGTLPLQAQSPTTDPTPTQSDKTKQIEELKERLATKVAELRQSQRMAAYGKVKSVSISTFIVETKTKDLKIELTDDIQIFQIIKGKRTTLTTENLAKDDVVTVFGEYDNTLELLKAKIVFIQGADPIRMNGTITDVDKENYAITIETPDKKSFTIDFEKTTKMFLWNGTTLVKGGFSNASIGSIIHVTGSEVPKKANRISATRITTLPQDTASAVSTPTKAATPSSSPR